MRDENANEKPHGPGAGIKECVETARPVCARLGAEKNLCAECPDEAHEYPRETRIRTYECIDAALRKQVDRRLVCDDPQ